MAPVLTMSVATIGESRTPASTVAATETGGESWAEAELMSRTTTSYEVPLAVVEATVSNSKPGVGFDVLCSEFGV